MTSRCHVFIQGRVQGVFFRLATLNEARKRGVVGWVRNLHDGRVEAIFEGTRDDVEALLTFCKRGPRYARVEKIESRWQRPTGEYVGFTAR
jgi:acylphosphatase